MNYTKWTAYKCAKYMKEKYPNGFNNEQWDKEIFEFIGEDRRTILKYRKAMLTRNYVVRDKEIWIINPDIHNMKPKSLSEAIRELKKGK